jgi:hypothetical protein
MIRSYRCCLVMLLIVAQMHNALTIDHSSAFTVGNFRFIDENASMPYIIDLLTQLLNGCVPLSQDYDQVASHWNLVQGQGLIIVAQRSKQTNNLYQWSHTANMCTGKVDGNLHKEMLWHVSLALWPWNTLVVKNYAYILDWHSYSSYSRALTDDCIALTADSGCLLHHIFSADSPLHLPATDEALIQYHRILASASSARNQAGNWNVNEDINFLFRELPLNHQYLGFSPGLLSRLFHQQVLAALPSLASLAMPFQPLFQVSSSRKRIGVMTEHDSNSSPALCFMVSIAE